MRIILFSGKGGSGVSTLAAATAAAVAEGGAQTLAFGLGAGLADAFGLEAPADAPTEVSERLEVLESGVNADAEDEFRDWLEDLLHWRGMDVALADDLGALPGLSHIGRLLELERCCQDERWHTIVVDASALTQFLDLPPALDAAARWLDRLFAPRQQNVFEPFLRVFAGDYADRGEDVFERGKELLTRLANLRDLLTDPKVTSVRVVLPPGRLAVAETMRAVSQLSLFSYATDAIVASRLLPDEVTDVFFATHREEQSSAVKHLAGVISPMPLLIALLHHTPPSGLPALLELAGSAYEGRDPAAVLFPAPGHDFMLRDGHYLLTLALPFARKEDMVLEETDDGVAVILNGRRCTLPLPGSVIGRQAESWTFADHVLTVTFPA